MRLFGDIQGIIVELLKSHFKYNISINYIFNNIYPGKTQQKLCA